MITGLPLNAGGVSANVRTATLAPFTTWIELLSKFRIATGAPMSTQASPTHSLGLVATCALGLEDFVAAELAALVPGRAGDWKLEGNSMAFRGV